MKPDNKIPSRWTTPKPPTREPIDAAGKPVEDHPGHPDTVETELQECDK